MKINNWFSHDSNARNDAKILNLRMKHGALGYGAYFMIIERLREESNYMSVKDYNAIAFDLRVDANVVKSIVEDFGLFAFTDDGECFYSKSLIDRMEIKDEKKKIFSDAGKKGMAKRWETKKNHNQNITTLSEKHNNSITRLSENDNEVITTLSKNDNHLITPLCENDNKLSKGKVSKESKVKNNKYICSPEANALFEKLWAMYPRKRGKNQITDAKKRAIAEVGEEKMVLALNRYNEEVKGMEEQYILNGSTFFNGRYKDYISEDFSPKKIGTSGVKATSFNNYSQREEDYDAMEKRAHQMLMERSRRDGNQIDALRQTDHKEE